MTVRLLVGLLLLSSGVLSTDTLIAAEKSAAQLLPVTSVVYLEIPEGPALVDTLLEHPVRERIEAIPSVKAALNNGDAAKFKLAVKFVEFQIGMKWSEGIKALTDGGVYVGFDAETKGACLLAHARDEETLTQLRKTLFKLGQNEAKKKGNPDPYKRHEYRGVEAFAVEKAAVVQLEDWLAVANKPDLAKKIIDNFLDADASCLADNEQFKSAQKQRPSKAVAWGYVNANAIRDAGLASQLMRERVQNPVVELVFGGLLSVAQNTPYMTADVTLDEKQVALQLSSPRDTAWIPQQREFFFGPDSSGAAPPPVELPNTLLSLESYRDVSAWWLAKEELYDENVVAQLAQADSQFSTLFSGLDFGDEVLASIKPASRFILARQSFDGDASETPDIKLPAGALIFELREPEKMQRRLKVAFQSIVGFANLGLAQQDQPQYELDIDSINGTKVISATLLPEEGQEGVINYNFSPAIAFPGKYFVISSSRELANAVSDQLSKADGKATRDDSAQVVNTQLTLEFDQLRKTLADNQQQLVAQTMLEEGKSKAEATTDIATLIDLIGAGKRAEFRIESDGDLMRLIASLTFSDE